MRTRRAEYSEATRQALVDSAVDLFTKRGYAGTSLDQVVKRARVTKGALYHHFSGKQALFEAAFAQVETQSIESLTAVLTADGDPWETAVAGLRAYVRKCLEPEYQRIIVHEAPVVMGWERWREAEEHFSFGLLLAAVQMLVDAGEIEEQPVEITARLLFGALSMAASMIASSSDPKRTGRDVERAILRVLDGMRKR